MFVKACISYRNIYVIQFIICLVGVWPIVRFLGLYQLLIRAGESGNGSGLLHSPDVTVDSAGDVYKVSLSAVQGPRWAVTDGEWSGYKLSAVTMCLKVSQPVEEWVPGEYELPEYFHYSTDSQKEDCPDLYTECGIYQRPGLHTLTENPLYNRTFNLMPPQHSAGADQRRVQFSVK